MLSAWQSVRRRGKPRGAGMANRANAANRKDKLAYWKGRRRLLQRGKSSSGGRLATRSFSKGLWSRVNTCKTDGICSNLGQRAACRICFTETRLNICIVPALGKSVCLDRRHRKDGENRASGILAVQLGL